MASSDSQGDEELKQIEEILLAYIPIRTSTGLRPYDEVVKLITAWADQRRKSSHGEVKDDKSK